MLDLDFSFLIFVLFFYAWLAEIKRETIRLAKWPCSSSDEKCVCRGYFCGKKKFKNTLKKRGTLWKQLSDQVKKAGQEIPTKDIDLMIELFLIVAKKKERKFISTFLKIIGSHQEFVLDEMIDKAWAFWVNEKWINYFKNLNSKKEFLISLLIVFSSYRFKIQINYSLFLLTN